MSSRTDYETWHDQFEVDKTADAPWHRLVKTHLSCASDLAGKRVLEIGCGRGGFTAWLASSINPPPRMTAVDFAASAVRSGRNFAAQQRLDSIIWEVGDIEAIPHPANTFDTVISCETIEHVPHPAIAVGELARVLKSGGRMLLTTPNYMGMMGLYRAYLRIRGRRFTEVGQPINHFTFLPRTRLLLERAGLKIQLIDAIGHYLPVPRRPPVPIPALDRPQARFLAKWFALHSLIVAVKP